MIIYKDIFKHLADCGYTIYRLQKENLIPSSTQGRIRAGAPVNLTTIDTICRLCTCQPGDLLEWIPDPED